MTWIPTHCEWRCIVNLPAENSASYTCSHQVFEKTSENHRAMFSGEAPHTSTGIRDTCTVHPLSQCTSTCTCTLT